MTYAVLQDLLNRFGETEIILLSDDAGAAIQPDIVAQILSDVDDDIDGFLSARYSLPLPEVPSVLVDWACDLARYQLASRNGTTRPTKDMRDRNDGVLRNLQDIADGKRALTVTVAGAALPGKGITQHAPGTPVFPKSELRDFMPMNRRRSIYNGD